MIRFILGTVLLTLPFYAQSMTVAKAGTQASIKGPAENFTGSVKVDPLFKANEPTHATGAYVTFEAGARSNWHTHPLGQTLVVTKGIGRVQAKGEAIQEIREGDVIWTPPGQMHWHGAAPDSSMTHMSITESLDGKAVNWLEKVTDEQYKK